MNTVILGLNHLHPSTWTTHEVEDVCAFLVKEFGTRFPPTGKIFHEEIGFNTEVTPRDGFDVTALQKLTGTFYVIIYPAGQQGAGAGLAFSSLIGGPAGFITSAVLIVGSLVVAWLLAPDRKPAPPRLRQLTGSPNNKLGDRQNTPRVLGRIPDIFGQVRATPDLLAGEYTQYINHREVKTSLLCLGKGLHTVTDIRDGDTLVSEIEGMSVGVYGPGNIPTGVDGTSTRQTQIGDFIPEPVWTVKQVAEVNGLPLLPDNAFTIMGDIAGDTNNDPAVWDKVAFKKKTTGVGYIYIGSPNTGNADKVRAGDKILLQFPTSRVGTPTGMEIYPKRTILNLEQTYWFAYQDGTGQIPDLSGEYTVVGLSAGWLGAANYFMEVSFADPGPLATEWDRIATYTAGIPSTSGSAGVISNSGAIITPINREWVGPFFVDDPLSAPLERTVILNFVATNGLYCDDGKNTKPFSIQMEIEVTPADVNGNPTGTPLGSDPLPTTTSLSGNVTLPGTVASKNTRALTAMLDVSVTQVQGRFLVRARRLTRTPWKQDAPSQFRGFRCFNAGFSTPNRPSTFKALNSVIEEAALAQTGPRLRKNDGGSGKGSSDITNTFNSSYLPFHGQVSDDISWTHCYSLTTVAPISFGDLTLLHVRSVSPENAQGKIEKKLSCLAYRNIQTWNGSTFGGSAVENNDCENVLFTILKDPHIGNLPDSQIDFPGIAAAFEEVRATFGGPDVDNIGGEKAGQFNYTFDDDRVSLEETISMICQAGFCTPYRDGDILRVKSELPSSASTVLFNHRNKLPGTEQRTVTFGTEQDYDGVRIDYVDTDVNDPTNYAIKTYTIPPLDVALRPKTLDVPGIRTRRHAAWHAWRAYYKLFYSNIVTEFQATEEAALLTLQDRILISDSTRDDTLEGEVESQSGATITTSQDVALGTVDHTIFLQHEDGTVEAIAISTNPDRRTLVLQATPSLPLITDDQYSVTRTKYIIQPNSSVVPTAFYVAGKEYTDKRTYTVTATNYSHAFYWYDGLYFWLPFTIQTGIPTIRDWGPYELDLATAGGASTTNDATRGTVYLGTGNTQHLSITTSNIFAAESYTKAAWVFRAAGVAGSILSSPETNDEFLLITSGNELQSGHNNTAYCQYPAFPGSSWHHVATTYDADAEILLLYVDGVLVDTATSVPARPIGNLRIFGQFSGSNGWTGRGDDLRYWMRVLSGEEVAELYRKTIL